MPAQDSSWNSKGFCNFSDWLAKSQIFTQVFHQDVCQEDLKTSAMPGGQGNFLRDFAPFG